MRSISLIFIFALVISNILCGALQNLDMQAPLTVLTFVACLLHTSTASRIRLNPSSLLCLTTAVFLLGRFFTSYVFGWGNFLQADWFLVGPMDSQLVAVALAATSLFLCGVALTTGELGKIEVVPEPMMGVIALRAVMLFTPFALYRIYQNLAFWSSGDYLTMYLEGGPGGLSYSLGGWAILCVFALLASKPQRVIAWLAYMFGIVLCAAEMLKGARGIAMAQIIGLTWLLIISQNLKFSLGKGAFGGLALVLVADYIGRARFGITSGDITLSNFGDTLFGFFFSQGVSLLFLVATLDNMNAFQPFIDGLRSTFAPLLDGIMRLTGSLPDGQSEEFARHTSSLAHRLAYLVDADKYLSGMGMGGSSVAEAMLYSPLIGPLAIGLLIGLLLRWLFLAGRNSSTGLFILASTFPFALLMPRETQLYFLVPLIKALAFAAIASIFIKSHAGKQSHRHSSDPNV